MGNSISLQPYQVSHIQNQHIWELQAQKQHCKIYRNLQTGSLCEEYMLELPSGKIRQDIEIYEDRFLTTHKNIVKVCYLNYERAPALCSNSDLFRVRTEAIPYRLSELNPFTVSESLFVLLESLSGFAEIVYRYGFVRIEPDMIGLSSDGKIKVWLNKNYAKCFAEEHSIFKNLEEEGVIVNEMIRELYSIVENKCKGHMLSDNAKHNVLKAMSFQEAISIVKQSIGLERLTITSVTLPGNNLKQTQLDLTKYSPTPISKQIAQPEPHRQPMHAKRIQRPSISTNRDQRKNYQQNVQPEIIKQKSIPNFRRAIQSLPSHPITVNSHPAVSHRPAQPPTARTMDNDFPAEFVQSQLIREVKPTTATQIKSADLAGNPQNSHSPFRASELPPRASGKQPMIRRVMDHPSHLRHPSVTVSTPSFEMQNNSQSKPRFRDPNASLPKNRSSAKLQPVLQNSVHNNSLTETARFTLQPSTFNKPIHLNGNNYYASQNNFQVNVLPPTQSKMRQTKHFYPDGPPSLTNQYVNSSFVPNVINNMSPSQVANSAPVGVFSGIEYGHGVVRNMMPRYHQ